MKPKGTSEHDDGLLEYLEDIIGTATLKAPIETALAEVERLGEERAEKVARLKIVEKEKAKLDAERKEALEWLKLANEHVRAQSRLWQYYLWQCLENDERFAVQIVSSSFVPFFLCAEGEDRNIGRRSLRRRESRIRMILRI
jgi:structural maintenance of chromosome 4